MHLKTLIVLLAGVLLLGGLAWWQLGVARREEQTVAERALLEGFDRARVTALRLDNLERSLQMRLERAPGGSWTIVDPIEFPANPSVLEALLEALATQRASAVVDPDPRKLGFAPPRVVLEVIEDLGGKTLERRIEIGQVDYGDQAVFVRSEGRIGRTTRALDTLLERDLPDWRARHVLTLAPRDVVELRRSGREIGPGQSLALEAVLDGGEWRATAPIAARLDPQMAARLVVGALSLEAHAFHDVGGPLSAYGLDDPYVRLEIVAASGESQVLLLAPEQGDSWFATREGSPYVVSVLTDFLAPVTLPAEQLVDRQLVRTDRESTTKVVLQGQGNQSVLTREGKAWRITGRVGGEVVVDDDPADARLVEEALGALERSRFEELLPGQGFDASESRGELRIELDGIEPSPGVMGEGGKFGPAYSAAGGVAGARFRREPDGMTGVIDPSLYALASRDPRSWRSLELHKVPEIEVSFVELAADGATRSFARESKGKWVRSGTTLEAKDFAKLVDPLLTMRATEVLPRGEQQVDRPLRVRIAAYAGDALEFELGTWTAPSGETWTVYRSGERFARVRPELLEALRATLQGE